MVGSVHVVCDLGRTLVRPVLTRPATELRSSSPRSRPSATRNRRSRSPVRHGGGQATRRHLEYGDRSTLLHRVYRAEAFDRERYGSIVCGARVQATLRLIEGDAGGVSDVGARTRAPRDGWPFDQRRRGSLLLASIDSRKSSISGGPRQCELSSVPQAERRLTSSCVRVRRTNRTKREAAEKQFKRQDCRLARPRD